jgi:hypothetical protein
MSQLGQPLTKSAASPLPVATVGLPSSTDTLRAACRDGERVPITALSFCSKPWFALGYSITARAIRVGGNEACGLECDDAGLTKRESQAVLRAPRLWSSRGQMLLAI